MEGRNRTEYTLPVAAAELGTKPVFSTSETPEFQSDEESESKSNNSVNEYHPALESIPESSTQYSQVPKYSPPAKRTQLSALSTEWQPRNNNLTTWASAGRPLPSAFPASSRAFDTGKYYTRPYEPKLQTSFEEDPNDYYDRESVERQDELVDQMLGLLYTPPQTVKTAPPPLSVFDQQQQPTMATPTTADYSSAFERPLPYETKKPQVQKSQTPTRFLHFAVAQSAAEALVAQLKPENVARVLNVGQGVTVEFYDVRQAWKCLSDYAFLNPFFTSYEAGGGNRLVVGNLPAGSTEQQLTTIFKPFGDLMSMQPVNEQSTAVMVEYFDVRDAAFAQQNLHQLSLKTANQSQPLICLFCRNFEDAKRLILGSERIYNAISSYHRASQQSFAPLDFVEEERREKAQPAAVVGTPSPPLYSAVIKKSQHLSDQSSVISAESSASSASPVLYKPAVAVVVEEQQKERVGDNQLDLLKIQSGQDKRTTFMIRNIPNKYSQKMLLEMIEETHKGQFDFVYLRMDFKNKCNVGYAFINFIDPRSAVSFALKVCGKKWTKFNSDKICTMSYANIQGKQALIEKFRNSQVMLEEPAYRPKIFYSSGPRKGEEEPFPLPTMPIPSGGPQRGVKHYDSSPPAKQQLSRQSSSQQSSSQYSHQSQQQRRQPEKRDVSSHFYTPNQ